MDSSQILMLIGVVSAAALLVAAIAGVMLLARIAQGLGDLRERMDDLKVRLGVLDPGETRVNPLSQSFHAQVKSSPSPNAPDETLPGNG